MEPRVLVVLLGAALLYFVQCHPVERGHVLDYAGRVRRVRRDVLPFEDHMMSLPVVEEAWRGRGLEQVLQQLVERDQRREQQVEQQQTAYLSDMLQLLTDAEREGLVNPNLLVELNQEQEMKTLPEYEDTSPRLDMRWSEDPWWRSHLAKALLQRLDPDYTEALLSKLQQTQRSGPRERDRETFRRLIGQILSSMGPKDAVSSYGHRLRLDLSNYAPSSISTTHRRSRRSLQDTFPSEDSPMLEEDELKTRPLQGLQRVKRIDIEKDHGSHRRKRREVVNYDPQILLRQVLELIRE